MNLNQLAEKLFPAFISRAENLNPCRIFLSASDMKTRAVTRHATADNPAEAWNIALEKLKDALGNAKIFILRADWIIGSQSATWENFLKILGETPRNHFQQGIALDADFNLAFTENELNANSMLDADDDENSVLNSERCNDYCKIRFEQDFPTPEPSNPVEIFTTAGIFISEDEENPLPIVSNGHREISCTDSEIILKIARGGARHLANQVHKSGKFFYGRTACFDIPIKIYEAAGHFGAVFALLNVYSTYRMGEIKIGSAIAKAIKFGVENFIKYRKLPGGAEAAYVIEPDKKEIKLGALSLALIALVRHAELMKTKKYYPLMDSLARGILTMQKQDGSFVHVLNSENLMAKEEVGDYDGAAILAMLQLYSVNRAEILLKSCGRALKNSFDADRWQSDDLFLAEAPTLSGMKNISEVADILAKIPLEDFSSAMTARAKNLLDSCFYPEVAMFFQTPENIVGSFFVRRDAFRVCIDDEARCLSALVAYRKYLKI